MAIEVGAPLKFRTSTAEVVTKQMRQDLLDGTIPAGSRILARSLAERFQVSIVPVREAIKRLVAEGLLVSSPQRATFAAEIGFEDISGVYDVRQILEVELARRAVALADDAALEKCDAALTVLLSAELKKPEFFEAHRRFHWCLIEPAASAVAQQVLERLWTNVDRYMSVAIQSLGDQQQQAYRKNFNESHSHLAQMFKKRDENGLRELMTSHLLDTENSLKAALTKPT